MKSRCVAIVPRRWFEAEHRCRKTALEGDTLCLVHRQAAAAAANRAYRG